MTTKHTPGPLERVECSIGEGGASIYDGDVGTLATVTDEMRDWEKHAKRLALCWNTHDELLEALESMLHAWRNRTQDMETRDLLDGEAEAEAAAIIAISKAKGETA